MEKLKQNKEKIFIYVSLFVYAIMSLLSAIFHESWADEAQAWSIAKDLNIFEIINQMKYEGHSCMWHLILHPFAKLGFPYETLKIISWLFCLAGAYVILKKAPFNKIVKLLLVFNPGMTYLFPAISRPYCMIPLLISCICVLYNKKEEKADIYAIFLALLANTHLIMLPMVGMLVLDFWGEKLILKRKTLKKEEKKNLIISLFIVIFGMIIFLLQAAPSAVECKLVDSVDVSKFITNGKFLYMAIKFGLYNMSLMLMGIDVISMYFILFVLVLLIIASFFNKRQAFIFWPQFIFFMILHTMIWILNIQRVFSIIYMLMFWVWNCANKKEVDCNGDKIYIRVIKKVTNNLAYIALIILLIMTFLNYRMYTKDLYGKYSNSKITASYIQEYLPEDSIFLCVPPEAVSSIIPYLDIDKYHFYSLSNKDFYSFVTWDKNWLSGIQKEDATEAIEYFKKQGKSEVYILSIKGLAESMEFYNYEKIYETTEPVIWDIYSGTNEEYEIYRVDLK